jgi:hypothetical protein
MAHRFQAGEEFQQAGFMGRTVAEVGRDRRDETICVVMHQRQQRVQPRLAPIAFDHRVAPGSGVHGLEDAPEAGRRRRCCWAAGSLAFIPRLLLDGLILPV